MHRLTFLVSLLMTSFAIASKIKSMSSFAIITQCASMHRSICMQLYSNNFFQRNQRYSASVIRFNLSPSRRNMVLHAASEKKREMCNSAIINKNDLSNVNHWFILSLPEGVCVGVSTASDLKSFDDDKITTLHMPSSLHDEEYDWGQENMTNEKSRTSFYLGRMALRSSLHIMLCNHDVARTKQLRDQIQNNPIKKDVLGRPILPNAVVGSISHKGEYAVGLSSLRFEDASSFLPDNDMMYLNWKEDCRILPDEEGEPSTQISAERGIGVDIERVYDERCERLQHKILTDKEVQELGDLEVTCYSIFYCSSSIAIQNNKRKYF